MADKIDTLSQSIAEEVINISHDELQQQLIEEITHSSGDLLFKIKEKIIEFVKVVEEYEKSHPKYFATIGQELAALEKKKDMIYARFFEIQNLINLFIGQKVVMTYVHVDDQGRREIRISENDIEHLGISEGMWGNNPYHKLSYDVQNHYKLLQNSLPEEDNEKLQQTAAEVERRYDKYKKRVLWYYPSQWNGYVFSKKGPINEAFVDMYVHQIKLNSSLEGNIDEFMLGAHGAIKADATKGFLIGDVSKGGIQYAVKGAFGSPQGVKDIVKEFKKIIDEDFSMSSFYSFIEKYTEQELEKKYKPQIKEMSNRSMSAFLRYNEKEINKEIKVQMYL